MGRLFESLDILPSSEVYQCSASDFSTGYVGQAAGKTRQKFEEARGGVLFIDEAYRLCENGHQAGYMKEAVDEIVQILTEDDFKGKMVVIFAGYEHEIKRMLDSVNPGLKSRVSQTLKFPPFDARAATALLEILLENKRIEVAPGVASELPSLARVLVDAPQWASGRDVTTWAQRVSRKCAQRNSFQATADICRSAMESLLTEKSSSSFSPPLAEPSSFGAVATATSNTTAPAISTTTNTADVEEEVKRERQPDGGGGADPISAALQEACVKLGYDEDQESRKKLRQILENAARGGKDLSEDILEWVQEKTGADRTAIIQSLRPQIPAVLASIQAKIKYDEDLQAELDRLEEEEREAAIARERAMQKKLMRLCPAGYRWYREGNGWRCGGGAHFVRDGDPCLWGD